MDSGEQFMCIVNSQQMHRRCVASRPVGRSPVASPPATRCSSVFGSHSSYVNAQRAVTNNDLQPETPNAQMMACNREYFMHQLNNIRSRFLFRMAIWMGSIFVCVCTLPVVQCIQVIHRSPRQTDSHSVSVSPRIVARFVWPHIVCDKSSFGSFN